MSHKNFNLFSVSQQNFGDADDYAGWEVTSTYGAIARLVDRPFYNKYIPGAEYESSLTSNSLGVATDNASDIVLKSPWVAVNPLERYIVSAMFAAQTNDVNISLDVEEGAISSGTGTLIGTGPSLDHDQSSAGRLFGLFTTGVATSFARMVVTITGQGGDPLESGSFVWMFDPVFSEDSSSRTGIVTNAVYDSLPNFMLLDDENINDIVSSTQLPRPLFRFVEALCAQIDHVYDETVEFDYVRAVEGVEHKSILTDPDTARAGYLLWLATVTGTSLLTLATGFTPWEGLEAADTDEDGTPGEWEDISSESDPATWLAVQDLDPDFFDSIQSFRDQIRTGFTGLNAGRQDTIEEFVRTTLNGSATASDVVVVKNNDLDNPFKIEVLVDPSLDPDPDGDLIPDAVNQGLSVGATATKTGQVLNSGRGSYDLSKLVYPATYSDSDSGGAVVYQKSFISDMDGFARHIRLNESSDADYVELGGGVADSHFDSTSSYFYGETSGGYGSLTTATSTLADLGGSAAGFDVVMVLSDIQTFSADLSTVDSGGNTPADWLFREKRLLVCGKDASSNNDWAVYLASGVTSERDTAIRMLLVTGYNNASTGQFETAYAYSDPIDIVALSAVGDVVLRVKREVGTPITDGYSAVVDFYAQSSLYDDWESHEVSSTTINDYSVSGGATSYVQVLGSLSATNTWANANPLSCAVKRVLVFNSPLDFIGESDVSSEAHAYVVGGEVTSFAYYTYNPTVDIDVSVASAYASTFDASLSTGATLGVTVNEDSVVDLSVYAMRPLAGTDDVWYFGYTANSASANNELSAALSNSTSYDVKSFVVTPSDGTVASHVKTHTTSGTGDLLLDLDTEYNGSADTYNDVNVTAIEVYDSSDGSASGTRVAYFLPNTLGASSGVDDDATTWTIARTFGAVNYMPAQLVDRPALHFHEGSPSMNNPPPIEVHSEFSIVLHIRRHWTDVTTVEYDIFRLENASEEGLRVYFDGPDVKATFTDGTNTESLSWTESPDYGDWHVVVIRRDPASDVFSMVVDGVEEDSTTISAVDTFVEKINSGTFSEGASGEWNPRFGMAAFVGYTRYLSDGEITLLDSQIS
jgi:hypothetical protein